MFRLALSLGCTVQELGERLSSAELAEWQAFYLIEPFGDMRADDRARLLALASGNLKTGDPAEILPTYRPQEPETAADRVMSFVASLDAAAVEKAGD
jgi:hypothetical protein